MRWPRASVTELQDALLGWYASHGRDLPWREVDDPYAILVLEVMSQQTQLGRVEAAWHAFLERWPTPASLAAVPAGDVIAFWSDHRLGYNRRAEYLHRAARRVVERFDGEIPSARDDLETLPGVGPYTAAAVASFAFEADVAVVDTNVRRIVCRLTGDPDADVEAIADDLVPTDGAARWNNAMMDLGATVCTPSPRCDAADCPLRFSCKAYETGEFVDSGAGEQAPFAGSRRQYRGRIVRVLADRGPLGLDPLGQAVHDEYDPDAEFGRGWLMELLEDLAADDLVTIEEGDPPTVRLPARSAQA